jgi:CelD/BcsL family acetyltransferase involved in cellulose biosynthesis
MGQGSFARISAPEIGVQRGEGSLSLTDAPPRLRSGQAARRFAVELFDGRDLAAARWPSIAAGPELLMHAFQSREFLDVWTATIGCARNAQCVLIVVTDSDEKPVLYLPVSIETRFGTRILRFMDAGVVDLNAPILVAGQDLTRGEFLDVWSKILSLLPAIDVVDLQKMPGTVGAAHNPLTYLACRPNKSSGHVVDLGKWREVVARRSTVRMHSKLRRHLRRLSEIEPTAFLVNPSGPRWHEVMDRLTEIKRKQYLRTFSSDFFAAPGVLDFYREIAAPERLGRISHLSALTCGSEIVAAHLGFIGRDRFYYILPAFDTEYRSFAVGLVLLRRLIEQCADQEYETFDLGEGDYSYKETWATHRLPLWSYEHGLTSAGRIYGQLRRARRFLDVGQLYELCTGGGRMRSTRPADGVQ